MNTNWLFTNARESFPHEEKKIVGGVECSISLSPYDIPQAVRAYEDKKNNFFIIEFKYPTDEEVSEKIHNQFTRIDCGINSGRIYRLKFDLAELKKQMENQAFPNWKTEIEAAMDDLSHKPSSNRLSEHYNLTKNVLLNHQDRLFPKLEAQRR